MIWLRKNGPIRRIAVNRKSWLKGKRKPKFKPPRPERVPRTRTTGPLWVTIPFAIYFLVVGLVGNVILFILSYPRLYIETFGDQWDEHVRSSNFLVFLCFIPWIMISSIWRIYITLGYWEERDHWLLQYNRYLNDLADEPTTLPWVNR